MTLRLALVGGPMYDHLYELLHDHDVEVVVHADHPTLNREVAARLAAGERLDVISTHSKYAPSQAHWLTPLDDVVATTELAPLAVELCRFGGTQYCVPRLIDVRILWARSDRSVPAPTTWTDLIDTATPFGFPGRESGLFGTFFELVVGSGGHLFEDNRRPALDSAESVAAVTTLCALAAHAPTDLPTWHYDQVDRALLEGRVDAAGAWPGAWGAIRDSVLASVLEPHPYPSGTMRRVSYAGCHAWAVPRTCGDVAGALELVGLLTSRAANELDASGGTVCAHTAAFAAIEPTSDLDRRRLDITARTIAESMITYPPHPRFPELEDLGWQAINEAIRGLQSPAEAVKAMQLTALSVLG
jgi:multiple sugar transport system substrate-binding protein